MNRRHVLMLSAVVALGLVVHPGAGAQPSSGEEIDLQGLTLSQVQDRLFGSSGLLSQPTRAEVHVRGIVLTPEQEQAFFVRTGSRDFAAVVAAVEQSRLRDVRLRGVVEVPTTGGAVNRVAFEAKVAGREVKVEGLTLTQAQFDSLVSALQSVSGLREFKVEAVVDGKRVAAKFENGVLRTETKGERRGRDASRTTSDRSDRGRSEATDRAVSPERVEKVEKVERPQRVERTERVQVERVDRPERRGH
jgi:hypothetical protein